MTATAACVTCGNPLPEAVAGRREELASLARTETRPLVSLVGSAGAGKTKPAL